VRNPVRLGGFSAGRRWMTIVAMLAIGSVLLAACGGDDDEDETPTPQPAVSTPTAAAAESPEIEPTEAESPAASPVTSPMASPTEVVPPVMSPVTSPEASPTEMVPPPVTSPEASPTEVVPPPVTSPVASPTEAASPAASPEASPMGSPEASPASNAVTIKLLDIRFDPNEVTIPANTDVAVTLPNDGVAPHNFSIDELGIDVDVQPGDEAVVLINAPAGEYKFYCNVPGHEAAGMVGTLTVQ
jgi:plastocyanin